MNADRQEKKILQRRLQYMQFVSIVFTISAVGGFMNWEGDLAQGLPRFICVLIFSTLAGSLAYFGVIRLFDKK